MRRLVLMRHAKAERASPGGGDFDRALTERGRRDASIMAGVLDGAGIVPDKVLVSSALRTRETWEAMAAAFPQAQVAFSRALYHAEPDALLDAIEDEEDSDTVMVVAHNPGVHALALRILKVGSAPPSDLARFDRGYPTSTVSVFSIDEAGRAAYEALFLAADHGGGGGE